MCRNGKCPVAAKMALRNEKGPSLQRHAPLWKWPNTVFPSQRLKGMCRYKKWPSKVFPSQRAIVKATIS